MKICLPDHHSPVGNSFGYSRWADAMRRALAALGAWTNDALAADALVHITPPHLFRPVPDAFNVLLTTFEAEFLPRDYRAACAAADLVVVPSRHNQRVFAAAGVAAERCPLGIDPECFRFAARRHPLPGERFRYLWVGAPNPRKGWRLVDRVWGREFARDPRVELYVKTTGGDGAVARSGNVIADARTLSDTELAALYASSHCFTFPSYGEGFGLTLAEAMATGLPCIFSPYGGVCDFANRNNAYPLAMRMVRVEYFGANLMAMADSADLAAQMRAVEQDYGAALSKGRRAAEVVHRLTWRAAAASLIAILHSRPAARRAA